MDGRSPDWARSLVRALSTEALCPRAQAQAAAHLMRIKEAAIGTECSHESVPLKPKPHERILARSVRA